MEKIQEQGPMINAWSYFAPEAEVDCLECLAQLEPINPNDENEQDNVPDFQVNRESRGAAPPTEAPKLSPDFVKKLY